MSVGCTDAAPRPVHPRPTRRDAGGSPQTARPCHVVLHRATWRFPNRADAAEIGADTAEIGADSVRIGRIGRYRPKRPVRPKFKKKKKKGAKRTVWLNLNTQTPSAPHTSSKTPKHPLSLRPSSPFSVCSVPHLSSLCSELSVSAVCTLHCFRH